MARPARKPDYTPQDRQGWQPRVITGGGEGGDGERPDLRIVGGSEGQGSNVETPSQEAQKPRHLSLVPALNDAEAKAAGGLDTKGDAARQEAAAKFGDPKGLYARSREQSRENRRRGSPRGLFIGLGAGGGIVSVIAGFSFMLPFKLPGIMDTLVGDAGKRMEKVIERRAERVFMKFVLRGSNAAKLNGNLIITGNPIGDYFANLRTADFELDLKEQFGLEFKPGPDKSVTLVHDGRDLGSAKNTDDLLKILDSGKSLSRSDLRKIVRATQSWPFWKRAIFVDWLRHKYNIPRLGARSIEATETEQAYNEAVMKEHIDGVEANGNFVNATDFIECVANSGDCSNADKTNSAKGLMERAKEGITQSAKDLSTKATSKLTDLAIKAALPKIIATSAALAIPFVGEIDTAARLVHGLGKIIDDDLLQKKHAEYIARSSGVLGAYFAAYGDQTKAGDFPGSTVGMFADRFDGWEESVSYGLINSGKAVGATLEGIERVNETVTLPVFAGIVKGMFGTVGWLGRAPFEAWYYTISQAFDLAGNIAGDAKDYIIKFIPGAQALMDKLSPFIADIFEGIFKFLGMYIDPLAIGAKLAMYIHQGFLASFNGMAKELGMRLLSHTQGVAMDKEIRDDRIADLAGMSLYDRLLNLNNSNSLATTLATTIPGSSNPMLAIATSSTRLVARAPNNFARITTATSYAADDVTSEELFGIHMYGGTPADLSAELDPSVESNAPVTCPENKDDDFNHCRVDPTVVEGMNCSVVKCARMNTTNLGEFDRMFASEPTTPTFTRVTNPISAINQTVINMVSPVMLETRKEART